MQFQISIDQAALNRAINAAPQQVQQEIRIANKTACREIAALSRANHRFKTKTGAAERSIRFEVSQDGFTGHVFIDRNIAQHAIYQHEGTKPHTVKPKSRSALTWVSGGVKRFSMGHMVRGIKPEKFVYRAAIKLKQHVVDVMEHAVSSALKKAGF